MTTAVRHQESPPAISVLLVTYNHAAYVESALDSIAAQVTGRPIEIVVADDSSTDGTTEIIERWVADRPELRVVVLPPVGNLGITKNYWRGLAACRGTYVAVLEGDDQWIAADKLERQADVLDQHADLAMVACRVVLYDSDAEDGHVVPLMGSDRHLSRVTSAELATMNWFATFSACMYRTACLQRISPEVFERVSFDWAIGMAVTEFGDAGFLPQAMTMYRTHSRGHWSGKSELDRLDQLHGLIPQYMEIFGERLALPLQQNLRLVERQILHLQHQDPAPRPEPAAPLGYPVPRVTARPPRVSVVVAAYNHERFVVDALNSVLDQTFGDLELIVVDDGSKDGTWAAIQTVSDPRMRSYRLGENQGGAAALNIGIQEARGEFVAVLNSDDMWAPDKLRRQLAVMDERPELGAVFTSARFVDEQGRPMPAGSVLPWHDVFRSHNRSQAQWLRYFFDKGNALCHPSILVRRRFYLEHGLYDNRLRQLPDLAMWVELVKAYPIHVMNTEDLVLFRMLTESANTSAVTEVSVARTFREHLIVMERFFEGCSDEMLVEGFADVMASDVINTAEDRRVAEMLLWLNAPCPMHQINKVHGLRMFYELLGDERCARLLRVREGIRDLTFHEQTGALRGFEVSGEAPWTALTSPVPAAPLVAEKVPTRALLLIVLDRMRRTPFRSWPVRVRHHLARSR
ncbi:glycosyltransferase family 2 protein [Actinotalea solisilvae]|uniref:glycosyltransferase family 2 protein n=1 Tax=Actinotalea solisilvae TaxID=2072922 RepID=UPI0018F21940|nr:glycosyltransferase [Actinotalea solisilvae]